MTWNLLLTVLGGVCCFMAGKHYQRSLRQDCRDCYRSGARDMMRAVTEAFKRKGFDVDLSYEIRDDEVN